jgi:hypothetical protein
MNTAMGGGNAAFGEMIFTKARTPAGMTDDKHGPAINVWYANNLSITNSVFDDLRAAGSNGLAVFGAGSSSTFTITDCNFENIQEEGENGGAALHVQGDPITIINCGFKNIQGRGISAFTGSVGSITITDCNFENIQTAKGSGAAINTYAGSSSTITGCSFKNTHAQRYGGAVVAYGDLVIIKDCDFQNTRLKNTDEGGYGGAVYASGDIVTIENYTSNATEATVRGGSLYIHNSGHLSFTNASITDSEENIWRLREERYFLIIVPSLLIVTSLP